MYVAKRRGMNSYLSKDGRYMTKVFSDAGQFKTAELASIAARDLGVHGAYFEFIHTKFAVQDQVRAFIRDYEKDEERTGGEKAAVAAMKTLVFHAEGGTDLGVLENSTLRAIQVLQAFMGLLSRMDAKNETLSDTPATLQEQAGDQSVSVPIQRSEDSGGTNTG